MKFIQFKDGSCDIKFSIKERLNLFLKGKLLLTPDNVRHFGNNLVRVVVELNEKLDTKTKNKLTTSNEVKTK